MTVVALLQSRKHHWLCVTCVVLMNRKRTDRLLYETIHKEGKTERCFWKLTLPQKAAWTPVLQMSPISKQENNQRQHLV